MTIADRLLNMYIHPWFPPGRECSDDQLPVREAMLAAHRAAVLNDDVATLEHLRIAAKLAGSICWNVLRDHVSEFIERFDLMRIAQYDTATREEAEGWVREQHRHVEPGAELNRLVANACAHIHLANTGKWKP